MSSLHTPTIYITFDPTQKMKRAQTLAEPIITEVSVGNSWRGDDQSNE